jgi:small subunit ribosomal protein S16
MLKIRLKRVGRKHDPSFRIVVTESARGPKSGKYLEMLGSYDPRRDNPSIKTERVRYWISKGAQVSNTVYNLLIDQKIIEGKKKNVLPRKTPIVKDEEIENKEKDGSDVSEGEEDKGGEQSKSGEESGLENPMGEKTSEASE